MVKYENILKAIDDYYTKNKPKKNEYFRDYPEYHHFRKKVKERDQVCLKCGADKNLEIHHIYPYKKYDTLRTEISNGITLCHACHKKYHKEFGRKTNVNPITLIQYLNDNNTAKQEHDHKKRKMIIGHKNLTKLFPDFKDDIAENGIDLRIGELYIINKKQSNHNGMVGCIKDVKLPPTYSKISKEHKNHYVLRPKNFYFIQIDRPIHIPKGHIQQYYLRSTFSRCGLILTDAIGDSDFNGTLMLGAYNSGPVDIHVGFNERIIQAVTIKTDGTDTSYNGSYQNDELYKEKGNLEEK